MQEKKDLFRRFINDYIFNVIYVKLFNIVDKGEFYE